MEIIPVLDVMGERAVAGKSGERETYSELKTIFSDSSDPVGIAETLPFDRLYVADLDGIMRGEPDLKLLDRLSRVKKVLVDIGIRDYKDFQKLDPLDVDVIVATETLKSPDRLQDMLHGAIVSIDMKDRKVLSPFLPEEVSEAFDFLKNMDAKRFIFLDISSVGTLTGNRFDFLRALDWSSEEITVGGGITGDDLKVLEEMGVKGALVGTALHRGLIK
ncbi:MAG: HisA/HisF-related TIM barrel protein [Candidatus Hydrothermarchaeales archaeon]